VGTVSRRTRGPRSRRRCGDSQNLYMRLRILHALVRAPALRWTYPSPMGTADRKPPDHPSSHLGRLRPGADWRARLRVRIRRQQLDRRIADGARPAENPLLELRAHQLSARSEREAIAACFENVLDAAAECEGDPATHVVVDHRSVIEARYDIAHLIDLLHANETVDIRGVALAPACPRPRRIAHPPPERQGPAGCGRGDRRRALSCARRHASCAS
jgi:hypothetical protein